MSFGTVILPFARPKHVILSIVIASLLLKLGVGFTWICPVTLVSGPHSFPVLEITYVYIVISVSVVSGVPEIVISPTPDDCALTPFGNLNTPAFSQ